MSRRRKRVQRAVMSNDNVQRAVDRIVSRNVARLAIVGRIELTEPQKVERDRARYGTGYARVHADGTVEHVSADEAAWAAVWAEPETGGEG